jgi:hypothetical protein
MGDQDDNADAEPLAWEAQLNQRCDELATIHLDSAMSTLPLVHFLPNSRVGLIVYRDPPSPIINRHNLGPWQVYQLTEPTYVNTTAGRQKFLILLIGPHSICALSLCLSFKECALSRG